MSIIIKNARKAKRMSKSIKNRWKKPFKKIKVPSSLDDHNQNAYHFAPKKTVKSPLIVSLHSWAGTYKQPDPVISKSCVEIGWNYIHPDFRGVNDNPQSVGSDLSMSDINDAIQYAIDNGNVDMNNIFIVGGSGGAYASLCFYPKAEYPINSYIVWSPITDLVAWHDQSIIRKERYTQDILNATNSNDELDIKEAEKRSPLYRDMPEHDSEMHIFTGYHDGYDGNGPVPVTHSLNYFNEYATKHNAQLSDLISNDDIINLTAREHQDTDSLIENRKIVYSNSFKNIHVTVFDGGHEHLAKHTVKIIKKSIK